VIRLCSKIHASVLDDQAAAASVAALAVKDVYDKR
jgi:hypothetical protein